MMRVWMMGVCLATVLPLVALLAWIWPTLVARWRQARLASRLGLVGLWLAGSGFMLFFPHEDVFTGLDNMTYPLMAHAFLDGRGFHDPDTVLAEVPERLREDFLIHRATWGRPTRDRVFQLSGWHAIQTEPFFLPALPLAAAGLEPLLGPERFVPLIGALWLALVLAAGFCAGGGLGVWVVVVMVLGTAWPAWFLRGFYAEAVGAVLVTGVVASSSVRPLRRGMMCVAGFALGLAITYHPTLLVLSVPIVLGLALELGEWKPTALLLGGFGVGLVPCWAVNRYVCQPYGNITNWEQIRRLAAVEPGNRAMAVAVGLLVLVLACALCIGFSKTARTWLARIPERWRRGAWLLVCVLPLGLLGLPGGMTGHTLRVGAASVESGIHWPYGGLLMVGAGVVLLGQRPARERFWLAALCWGAMFFIFLKGAEIPVGLWSQRRFLPAVLIGIALLAPPLSAGLAQVQGRWRAGVLGVVVVLTAGAGLWNVVHWPVAFFTVNERGAKEWVQSISDRIGTNRWVVFDYYPDTIPYAAGLKHRVLGLNFASYDHWPEVAGWVASLVKTEEVWVATSWAPCSLEDGFRLDEVFAKTGSFPVVSAKMFFPAEPGTRGIENHFMRVVPLAPGEKAAQDKCLDGGPIALRGPWGRAGMSLTLPDGGRVPATWSREGSGVVGPVPPVGGSVRFVLQAASAQAAPQTLLIQPPWSTNATAIVVPPTYTVTAVSIPRLSSARADQAVSSPTGVYRLHAQIPYDPAGEGIRGFDRDLGALIHAIDIAVE